MYSIVIIHFFNEKKMQLAFTVNIIEKKKPQNNLSKKKVQKVKYLLL